jgi:hypothetical protein
MKQKDRQVAGLEDGLGAAAEDEFAGARMTESAHHNKVGRYIRCSLPEPICDRSLATGNPLRIGLDAVPAELVRHVGFRLARLSKAFIDSDYRYALGPGQQWHCGSDGARGCRVFLPPNRNRLDRRHPPGARHQENRAATSGKQSLDEIRHSGVPTGLTSHDDEITMARQRNEVRGIILLEHSPTRSNSIREARRVDFSNFPVPTEGFDVVPCRHSVALAVGSELAKSQIQSNATGEVEVVRSPGGRGNANSHVYAVEMGATRQCDSVGCFENRPVAIMAAHGNENRLHRDFL